MSHCRWKPVVTAVVALSLLPVAGVGAPTPGDGSLPLGAAAETEQAGKSGDDLDKLMSMDFDQLVNVDVAEAAVTIPTGTLTATTTGSVSPYTVAHISRDMIEKSGARTLNELLEIDTDLNKRNYIKRVADYRSEAAAVGVSATANF